MKNPLEAIAILDDMIEKDCHNLAESLEKKYEINHMQLMNRYAVFFTILGGATNNGWAMSVGATQLVYAMSPRGGLEMASGEMPETTEKSRAIRLFFVFLIVFFNMVPALQTNYLLEALDWLSFDSEVINSAGESGAYLADKLGDLGAILYFYFLKGKSGDGLVSKVKDVVGRVLARTSPQT